MKDFRENKNSSLKGSKVAGYQVNENTVKEMLTFMGVAPEGTMVQDAIGYLSANGMEINMNNLGEFLKGKSIISRLDLRGKK